MEDRIFDLLGGGGIWGLIIGVIGGLIAAIRILWLRLDELHRERRAELEKVLLAITNATQTISAGTDAMRALASAQQAIIAAIRRAPRRRGD